MGKKKYRITRADYIKMQRRASREEEIRTHGRPISHSRIEESKKGYNRRRSKESLRRERERSGED